jgi:hypothetical protein
MIKTAGHNTCGKYEQKEDYDGGISSRQAFIKNI